MKKISTLFILSPFIISGLFSQNLAEWEIQPSPVNEDLVSVCFPDDAHGWIISNAGTLLSTSDGGATWALFSFPLGRFESVHFPDTEHGCIVGWHEEASDSSLILMTSDGGILWAEADHPKVNKLNDVFFVNSTEGWAVGTYDALELNCCLHTFDGGVTWEMQMDLLVAGAELFGVHFRDAQMGVACGAGGTFLHTSSGGTAGWALNISMPLVDLNSVWNMGSQHGCAVGNEGTAVYTVNNWYQHIIQNSGTTENLNGVCAEPFSNKLWAVGNGGTILYSSSYLLGWTSQSSGTAEHLHDVSMLSDDEGWAVGDNGTILKYSVATPVESLMNPLQLTLTPNPSKGWVEVKLEDRETILRIEVIDLLGQVSKTIVPSEVRQRYSIDLSELQNGFYFLKIYSTRGYTLKRLIINS